MVVFGRFDVSDLLRNTRCPLIRPGTPKAKSPAGCSPCRARSVWARPERGVAGWDMALLATGAMLTRCLLPFLGSPRFSPDPITSDHNRSQDVAMLAHTGRTYRNAPRHVLPDRNLRHRAHAPAHRHARRLLSAQSLQIFWICRFDGARLLRWSHISERWPFCGVC